jgi:hypothetical protein
MAASGSNMIKSLNAISNIGVSEAFGKALLLAQAKDLPASFYLEPLGFCFVQ